MKQADTVIVALEPPDRTQLLSFLESMEERVKRLQSGPPNGELFFAEKALGIVRAVAEAQGIPTKGNP